MLIYVKLITKIKYIALYLTKNNIS